MPRGYVHLSADLKVHAVGRRGRVVDRLCTGFNVGIDTVVVGSGEDTEIVQRMKSDGVVWSTVAERSSVAGDSAIGDVVVGLGTQQEPIASENDIARDAISLYDPSSMPAQTFELSGKVGFFRRTWKKSRLVLA